MPPLRLLYVLPEFQPDFGGGIATVYGQLLPRLAEMGHDITVLLASRSHLDQPNHVWRGVSVQPLQSCDLQRGEAELRAWSHNAFLHYFLPTAWAAWYQAQALGSFDLVEVTDWALLFLPWLVQARSQPVVVSLHGSCGQVDWHGNPNGRSGEGQLVRLVETAALPLADRLIANSTLNAEFWWQQCGVRAQVIPPLVGGLDGADLGTTAEQPPRQRLRSDRGVVIARLQNWKGPEVLCKGLRLLPGQQVDWIGEDTPWQETSTSTAEHLRHQFPDVVDHQLHLLGRLPPDQVRERIHQAAFLCCPSLFDVFNVTVLEAMEGGTPVICSRQAGVSMLIEDGQTGFLFDPEHPYTLRQAIKRFQQFTPLEKANLSSTARKLFLASMSCSKITHDIINEYLLAVRSWQPREKNLWLSHVMEYGFRGSCTHQAKHRSHHRFCLVHPVVRALRKIRTLSVWLRS